ncbi:MAG: NAD kinase, partial [Alphaproteobacteria bacterium]|nr:NAD kinase [Alphaproteobacteria bacterium]
MSQTAKPKSGSRTLAFVASDAPPAQEAARLLTKRYASVAPEEADVIVALGGDGFMLEMLHRWLPRG